MSLDTRPAHALPIPQRPPRTWAQTANMLLFIIVFNIGCLMINGTQLAFLLPLKLLPFAWAQQLHEGGIRYTKGAFGNLLILMSQLFAPTKLVVTFETEGAGKFTPEELKKVVVRDAAANVISLRLPLQTVTIANHQVYSDWWYVWNLTHFMGTSKDIFIVLKRSLKWVPIVGWGMQLYNFIFLARSWTSDRIYLAAELSKLGRRAESQDIPFTFLLYPEGTLVSKDTRPISKKFANKMGIPDMTHTLLPRSTGLHYSLRSLAPRVPGLQLIDVTVAYPGIPPLEYGQSYYTLRSIFCDRTPPPAVHMHIRKFSVAADVPIGDISSSNPKTLPNRSKAADNSAVEVDIPETERVVFDEWLRDLWRDKDKKLEQFLAKGSFASGEPEYGLGEVKIPLKLNGIREVFDAYCFFVPAVVGYGWAKLKGY